MTVIAAALSLVVTAGCAATVPAAAAKPPKFPAGAVFDYQLGGAYKLPKGAKLVVRDRSDKPVASAYSICYVNGFQTQPGEAKQWPKETLLRKNGKLVVDQNWPDEYILDTSTPKKRAAIVKRVTPWIKGCAKAGYEAVEFDNLDSYTRSKKLLSFSDNLALATALVRVSHDAGLAAGQKNLGAHAAKLKAKAGFDFAITEACAAYSECGIYTKVYGKSVIDIEYADSLPRSFAKMCADPKSPKAMILRDRNLVTPGQKGYVYKACAQK